MEYFDFITLFDDYVNFFYSDLSKILSVKKICCVNRFVISFICLQNLQDNVIEIFEEMYLYITNKYRNCFFFLKGKQYFNISYIVFILVKKCH